MMRTVYYIGAIALTCLTLSQARASEPTAATMSNVRGVVKDTAGAPLPNVTLTIAQLRRVTTSGPDGRFTFQAVPVGKHHIDAILIGYARTDADVEVVEAGADVEITILMRPTPLRLANVVVTATPTGGDALGITQSTVDLSGRDLARSLSSNVAQTLEREPGLATRYNGPAATLPIVRGLTGDRIVVLQDGERSGDLSSSAQDHGLSIDPLSADRIEVVRGPASLLYGTNALGGVVNVISNDIPSAVPSHISGFIAGQAESVAPGGAVSAAFTFPVGKIALQVGGGFRAADPVTMGGGGKLRNSDSRNNHQLVGLGLIGGGGSLGLAYRRYDFRYGIPAAPDDDEAGIQIDGLRNHVTLRGDANGNNTFTLWSFTGSAQQYEHAEIEPSGEIGTKFDLKTQTFTASTKTQFGRWTGAFGLSGLLKQYSAIGEEALTPPADSWSGGVYAFQQFPLTARGEEGPGLQAGLRYDLFGLESKPTDERFGAPVTLDFNAFSGSVGLTVPVGNGTSLAFSVARAFRAPTVEELFSNGFHAATGTFDVGNPDLNAETNTGLEGVFRVQQERAHGQFSAYYNRIASFIAPNIVGDTVVDGEEVPLNRFTQGDASIAGVEASLELEVAPRMIVGAVADLVRGEFADGRNIPFMPAARIGGNARWDNGKFSLGADVRRGFAQNSVSGGDIDVATEPYTLVNASAGWTIIRGGLVHALTLRVDNATDARYRDATSFIKSYAFNPGRNFALVYKVLF